MAVSAERTAVRARLGVPPAALAWAALGFAGSVLLTIAGPRLGGGSVTWWFDPRIASDKDVQRLIFYVGVAVLIAGWLGLGSLAREPLLGARQVSVIVAVWCLPLVVGVPLFSRDIYSYLAQGTLAHLGVSPYQAAPAALGGLGQTHVLSAVDPFWRQATAPYGPLFIGVISLIVSVSGSHVVAGVLLIRAFDLIGLVLLAVFVPRLARSYGSDPARAAWLAVASPLILFQLVAPAHNDLLMVGLMVAGVSLAVDRQPLLGVAVCALAATVKLPAIVAVAFVAVAWARDEATWRGRITRIVQAGGAAVVTLAAITLITGFGTGWISGGLFSTPARVRLAITPATDVSWTAVRLLGDLGVSAGFHAVESVLRAVVFGACVVVGLAALYRTRWRTLVACLGTTLVVFAIGGPALWPWYLSWGLVLLAAWPRAQRSWLFVAALALASVLVKPGGILALPIGASPVVACLWLALGFILIWRWSRRRHRLVTGGERNEGLGSARSLVVER